MAAAASSKLSSAHPVKHHTMPKTAKKTEGKSKKGVSSYNLFMKEELAKLKKADAKLLHKDAFKTAAANWRARVGGAWKTASARAPASTIRMA